MDITFDRIDVLWFLLSIPLLIVTHIVTLKTRRQVSVKFAHFNLLSGSSVRHGEVSSYWSTMSRRDWIIVATRSVALMALILAASGTTLWYEGTASNFDYVLLIDNSNSMSATDFYPDRLEATKAAALNFLENIQQPAKVGVVSFAGITYVETKPTDDMTIVRQGIKGVTISNVGGTDIGGAIVTGSNLLLSSDRQKSLVLLTDGRSNLGIYMQDAIDYARRERITVSTIGVGTTAGGLLADLPLIPFTLDEDSLQYIANSTGGKYFRAQDQKQLLEAYEQLATASERTIARSMVGFFMALTLALLFFEWGFLGLTYRVIP